MLTLCTPKIPFESEVVRRWWTIPVGSHLPLTDGGVLKLVFPGLPGGPSGPDVRDAVFCTDLTKFVALARRKPQGFSPSG